jgi:hypothetical protein
MTESKDPREEAERLIASVLGSASVAAENLSGFATGSAECCVCPVCKAIAAARDPNPNVAEKLASGAGDLASGVASFLRTMARAASDLGNPGTGGTTGTTKASGTRDTATEDPWAAATRAAAEAEAAGTAPPTAAAAPASTGSRAPGAAAPPAPAATPDPPKPMAKKAVRPKAPTEPPAEEI